VNILVSGASGFIGRRLLKSLDLSLVKAIGRNLPEDFPNSQFYKKNIDSSADYSEALSHVDTVIHLAGRVHIMNESSQVDASSAYHEVNTLGTLNLAKQAQCVGVKRFIFVSTIKVNGESTESHQPFTASDKRRPSDDYAQSKSEAEALLLQLAEETGLEVVIIRPTLVYGPGVKANVASLMSLVSKGLPLPFGCINHNKRSLVSVTNLVDLIVTCTKHSKAANQVFLVSDDHDVSTSEMVCEIAKSLNKSQWQLPIPKWCYTLIGGVLGKQNMVDRLLGSLQVDITHTKETLGWTPPQTFEDGFKEMAETFLLNKENSK
jgi:UDP-glucose 4-epimerase